MRFLPPLPCTAWRCQSWLDILPRSDCSFGKPISNRSQGFRRTALLPIVVNEGNRVVPYAHGLALNPDSSLSRRSQPRAFLYNQLPQLLYQDTRITIPRDSFGNQIGSHGDASFKYVCRLGRYRMCSPVVVRLEPTQNYVPACPGYGI